MVAMAELVRQEQMAARLAAQLARVDDSGDGEIQLDELQARAPATVHLFDLADTDNDGAISPDEFATAQTGMQARMDGMREEPGRGWWNHHGGRHGE
jgi:Ca2+-binding EF-hand superfamily protein